VNQVLLIRTPDEGEEEDRRAGKTYLGDELLKNMGARVVLPCLLFCLLSFCVLYHGSAEGEA
jgi:hypothetical protein